MPAQLSADADLVAECLRGDRGAFRLIVERYQGMVCAIAYSITGDLAQSEDAAQDAFVAAWQQLATLREPARLRPWLSGIVRNTARSLTRKNRRDIVHQAEPISTQLPPAFSSSPEDTAARREEEALLWQVLEQIPEVYREPIVLYYREHQSISEVAETMGLTEDAVKQRLARGRQALKEQVATFVETTLRRTGPKAAFTAGVLAAVDQMAGPAIAAGTTVSSGSLGVLLGVGGGILGSLIGIAGGIFGTMCSIRNTKTLAERAFMIKLSIVAWIYSTILVGFFLFVAFWHQWLFQSALFQIAFWSVHGVVLITGIIWGNRRAAQLRADQQQEPK